MQTEQEITNKNQDDLITNVKELANKMFDENQEKEPETYKEYYRDFYCLIYFEGYFKGYTDSAFQLLSEVKEWSGITKQDIVKQYIKVHNLNRNKNKNGRNKKND